MTVKRIVSPNRWEGLSTDTKPTNSTHPGKVRAGDTFLETNTSKQYISLDDDGSSWVEKLAPAPGVAATSLGKAEDAAHASGDTGVMGLTVRQNTAAALAGTDGDYQPPISDASGRTHVVNSDIEKAEDAAHGSGDKGIMGLGVRKDVAGTLASTDGDYTPSQYDQMGRLRVTSSSGADFSTMFGQPTLMSQGNGSADWQRGSAVLSTHQKGSTGWVARLFGGVQSSWDDAAEVYIPVNEMHLPDLGSAEYSWFQTNAEEFGLEMVIWAHDPADFDKRAEITLSYLDTEKASGWDAHELATTNRFIFYGENLSGNTTCTTAATNYTWAQYQADAMFATWTIFRISFAWGYYTGNGVFEYAYLADVKINGAMVQLKPSAEEQLDIMRDDTAKALTTIPTWTFGEPTLYAGNQGDAVWAQPPASQAYQKGSTMWAAKLYAINTNDDWASVVIPVNEMKLTDMTAAQWTYYQKTASQVCGVNMVIWAHDPTDFSKRAEITQDPTLVGRDDAGFYREALDTTSTEWYFWGENVTGNTVCTTGGTKYTWAQFQTDPLFATWTIYRITFDRGWVASGTADDAWVTEITLNGQTIPLKPDSTGTGRIGHRYYTLGDTFSFTLSPKTPFRLLSAGITCATVLTTTELFTATVDAGRVATVYDHVIMSEDLFIGTRLNFFAAFGEGYDFRADDEIIFANANTGDDTIGLTVAYQTVYA